VAKKITLKVFATKTVAKNDIASHFATKVVAIKGISKKIATAPKCTGFKSHIK
jgi:hypothetical protein